MVTLCTDGDRRFAYYTYWRMYVCVRYLRVLFVCVSTQRKRTGRQVAEALTSQQWSLGVAVWGAIPIFSFLLFWISPKIFTASIYYFRNRDKSYALFYCRFSSGRHREVNQSCVSGVTNDRRPLTELGTPMGGGAVGRSASGPGVSVPTHSITPPMNWLPDHETWSYLGYFAETKRKEGAYLQGQPLLQQGQQGLPAPWGLSVKASLHCHSNDVKWRILLIPETCHLFISWGLALQPRRMHYKSTLFSAIKN